MKYPNLFKSRYPVLQGKNWINAIDPEDKQAFIQIGHMESNYGRSGGQATVKKHGKKHMKRIARIGGVVSSIRKWWNAAVALETMRIAEEARQTNN